MPLLTRRRWPILAAVLCLLLLGFQRVRKDRYEISLTDSRVKEARGILDPFQPPDEPSRTSGSSTSSSSTRESSSSSSSSSSRTSSSSSSSPTPTRTSREQSSTSSSTSATSTSFDIDTVTQVIVRTSDVSTSTSATQTPTQTPAQTSISPGAIIGLSVAGGIALLGIIAFFVWKFSSKRSGELDNEVIKWPEVNNHSSERDYAGTTAGYPDDEFDLHGGSHLDHNGGYQAAYADSQPNFYPASQDPYAVPPFPHQGVQAGMYHDDPSQQHLDAQGNYYDHHQQQYPQDPAYAHDPNAYQMQNMQRTTSPDAYPTQQMRTTSPGPQQAYSTYEHQGTSQEYGHSAQTHYGADEYAQGAPAGQPQVGRQSPGPYQATAGGPRY